MEKAAFFPPPRYRQVIGSHSVTSRQSKTLDFRPDMTSCDLYRMGSRGVDRDMSVSQKSSTLKGRIFDEDRVRRSSSPKVVERDTLGLMYQRPSAWSSTCARPSIAATICTLPKDYHRSRDMAQSTATSRLFDSVSRHPQFHESSNSAPADCTAHPKPRSLPAALLACGQGVRATRVSERVKYHLTSTHRPTVTSSIVNDGHRPSSSSGSQQGACLWVGVAETVDIQPISATALAATVDRDNREQCYECSDLLSNDSICCIALGHIYHRYCFNCYVCKRSLQDRKFYCVNQKFYCEDDYEYIGFVLYVDTCSVCGDIVADRVLRAMGNSYHVNCFRCNECRKSLYQQPFTVDIHSKPYCIDDYARLYAPKCDFCHEAITPSEGSSDVKRLVVADKNYHERCLCCQDCGKSLTDVNQQQQPHQSVCYPLNDRMLCLRCHLCRLSSATTAITTTVSSSCEPGTSWASFHDNNVTWPPVDVAYGGGQTSLFVDVTIDGDASSTCTMSDDVTTSDDVISNPGSDVLESPQQEANQQAQPAGGNSVWSVDSGHYSGASDDTVTSSDTETLDAGGEEEEDDDDENDDDDEKPLTTPETSARPRRSTVTSYDSLSILDLLADSRSTDL